MTLGRCTVAGRCGEPSYAYVEFFSRQQTASVACIQRVSECVPIPEPLKEDSAFKRPVITANEVAEAQIHTILKLPLYGHD